MTKPNQNYLSFKLKQITVKEKKRKFQTQKIIQFKPFDILAVPLSVWLIHINKSPPVML